jgi:hypothetical protein
MKGSQDDDIIFSPIAVQSYRRAGSVTERHIEYEALMRHGHEFKAKAATARVVFSTFGSPEKPSAMFQNP